MAHEKNDHLVTALFANRAAAEQAAKSLEQWDKQQKELSLGAIAVVNKSDSGHIEYHRHHVLTARHGGVAGLIGGGLLLGAGAVGATVLAAPAVVAAAGGAAASATLGAVMAAGITGTLAGTTGAVAGGAIGAVTGGVVSRVWGFKSEDLKTFGEGLTAGQAALLVHLGASEVEPTREQLIGLGGTDVFDHAIPAEVFRHVETTVAVTEVVTEAS